MKLKETVDFAAIFLAPKWLRKDEEVEYWGSLGLGNM